MMTITSISTTIMTARTHGSTPDDDDETVGSSPIQCSPLLLRQPERRVEILTVHSVMTVS